ncbi:MAG: uroporphyrinogen-III synthase [Muribaculaceae bacterium]|nr:uroporphyrinogen-III synthase [Muribaculaceae bacterium]MDE7080370.1 uroporphyrinogen-III synthase [Muribaculaceae bacterium]
MSIKKILVSQPKPSTPKSPYYDIAERHGVEVVFRPFIKVEGLSVKEFRHQKVNLADYTAVVLSSRHAVDNFFRLCEETRVSVPDTTKYFCTSESIALYLQKYIVYRKRKIFFSATGKLNDTQLLAAINKNKGERFLFPVSDVHDSGAPELDKLGINYDKVVMYRTVSNDFGPDEPFDFDMLLFFSPAGIDSLKKNFPDFNQDDPKVYIGTYGLPTAKAVTDAGLRLDYSAPTPEYPSMTAALDAFLTKVNGEPGK